MIYTDIILELTKENNYKEKIQILTIGIIKELEDNPDEDNINRAKYYLKSIMQAAEKTKEKEKRDFLNDLLTVISRKENFNVTIN